VNWDQIQGNWRQLKGKVKANWGDLTDDDLDVIDGRREELLGKLQKAYGIGKTEAEQQLSDFERSL